MDYPETYKALEAFITERIVQGDDVAIAPDTPLLEWGILTSLTTMELITFIQQEFGITIPVDRMFGENFMNLDRVTRLVTELRSESDAAPEGTGETHE